MKQLTLRRMAVSKDNINNELDQNTENQLSLLNSLIR